MLPVRNKITSANCNNERPWGRFKSDACIALSKVDDTRDFIENTFKGSLIPVRLSALDLSTHPFTEEREQDQRKMHDCSLDRHFDFKFHRV